MTALAEIRDLVANGIRHARHDHREVRLQIKPNSKHTEDGRYRFGFGNGWNCGCWHETVEEAAACLEKRLRG